jgi:hypothetical protein
MIRRFHTPWQPNFSYWKVQGRVRKVHMAYNELGNREACYFSSDSKNPPLRIALVGDSVWKCGYQGQEAALHYLLAQKMGKALDRTIVVTVLCLDNSDAHSVLGQLALYNNRSVLEKADFIFVTFVCASLNLSFRKQIPLEVKKRYLAEEAKIKWAHFGGFIGRNKWLRGWPLWALSESHLFRRVSEFLMYRVVDLEKKGQVERNFTRKIIDSSIPLPELNPKHVDALMVHSNTFFPGKIIFCTQQLAFSAKNYENYSVHIKWAPCQPDIQRPVIDKANRVLMRCAAEHNAMIFDTCNEIPPEREFFYDEGHLSDAGVELLAEKKSEFLQKLLLKKRI